MNLSNKADLEKGRNLNICFVAMQRSGHHSVIEWFMNGLHSDVIFINNYSRTDFIKMTHYKKYIHEGNLFFNKYNYNVEKKGVDFASCMSIRRDLHNHIESLDGREFKSVLIYNLEEQDPDDNQFKIKGTDLYIYVIRDPINMFASRIAKKNKNINDNFLFKKYTKWMSDHSVKIAEKYYKKFKENNILKNEIYINYNYMNSNSDYRNLVYSKLEEKNIFLRRSNEYYSKISKFGGGTSFSKEESEYGFNERYMIIFYSKYKHELISFFKKNEILLKYSKDIFKIDINKHIDDYEKNYLKIKHVSKGWGFEKWIVNCEKYCGKLLFFKKNKKCSWHYHKIKDEVFYIQSGSILVKFSDDDDIDNSNEIVLKKGDSFHIYTGLRHQMIALEDTELFEFSTEHFDSDSYRIIKGD